MLTTLIALAILLAALGSAWAYSRTGDTRYLVAAIAAAGICTLLLAGCVDPPTAPDPLSSRVEVPPPPKCQCAY